MKPDDITIWTFVPIPIAAYFLADIVLAIMTWKKPFFIELMKHTRRKKE